MADYLSEEEQLAKLKSWWEQYGVPAIVGLILVIGGAIGWRWYDGYNEERMGRASDLYREFQQSDGVARDAAAAALDGEFEDTSYQTLSLLVRARTAVDQGDFETAERHLRAAMAAAPEPVLADLARLRLARVLQQLDRSEDALTVLGQVRGGGYRPLALELKGDIHLARGERDLAHQAYVAAGEALAENAERPLLEMKINDTADANAS